MPINSIPQKLRIKEGDIILVLNSPVGFKEKLGKVPDRVSIVNSAKNYNQVHWFVKDRAQMEEELKKVLFLITGNAVCWIYYPKSTSKIQTDLTRDKGWEELEKHTEFQWISLISFDDTWSAFGIRLKNEKDKSNERLPKEREIFKYIDPIKKLIYLPDDFAATLNKNKKEKELFNSLSFTNRKEYVEWIVSAKREETRIKRIKESIERLKKEWKNPANR